MIRKRVGHHAGGAEDTALSYYVLGDYGIFGYQEPAVGGEYHMKFEYGYPSVPRGRWWRLVEWLRTRIFRFSPRSGALTYEATSPMKEKGGDET